MFVNSTHVSPARSILSSIFPLRRALVRAVTLCAVALTLTASVHAADTERWGVLMLNGKQAGWQVSTTREAPDTITSESKMSMSLGRGATALKVLMQSRFVETSAGKPISMWLRQELAAAPVEQLWEWRDADVKLTVTANGEVNESIIAKPEGAWLTPAAAEREVRARMKAGEKEITLRTIDPSMGMQVINVTRKDFAKDTVALASGPVSVTRCTSIVEGYPESTEFIDASGDAVKMETNLGGFNVTILRSDRASALGAFEGPEMMVSTFVRPDRPIANARGAAKSVFRLTVVDAGDKAAAKAGETMPDLPSVAGQSVSREGDALIVRVDARGSSAAGADRESKAFTQPSTLVNFDDSKVKALAKLALPDNDASPVAQKAETLRRFVHSYINRKELGVGLGSAAEVARTRVGDCTEHAVLLAALLRAHGIPSRVASGLIYADQFAGSADIFGYHMWAQAIVPGEGGEVWVNFDATLPDATPFDATHITLSVSAMDEGAVEKSLLTTARLMGRLKIEVKEVHAAETAPVK